jgi:hypothetical protein
MLPFKGFTTERRWRLVLVFMRAVLRWMTAPRGRYTTMVFDAIEEVEEEIKLVDREIAYQEKLVRKEPKRKRK